jgi:hypothetical protein
MIDSNSGFLIPFVGSLTLTTFKTAGRALISFGQSSHTQQNVHFALMQTAIPRDIRDSDSSFGHGNNLVPYIKTNRSTGSRSCEGVGWGRNGELCELFLCGTDKSCVRGFCGRPLSLEDLQCLSG